MVTSSNTDSIWVANGQNIYLEVPPEFNFTHCLRFLDRSALECLHRVDGHGLRKLLKIDGQLVLIQVEMSSEGLRAFPLNILLSTQEQKKVASYLIEVFDLSRDLKPFYQQMKEDPLLEPLCKSFYGLRLIGIPALLEALSWSIIGQQINLTFAYTLKQRLVTALGERLHYEGTDYYLFPKAENIAEMSSADFSKWQYSDSKARYLIGVAQKIYEDKVNKQMLIKMSEEETLACLMQLKGIGPWSAHYVLMKCLRKTEAYPVDDVGLQNAIKGSLGYSEKPSRVELEKFGANWYPWQAYATFYLWHSLIT